MARSSNSSIAILPIHPEFANEILSGAKRVEFRRRTFAREVSHVVIYATAPEMRVIGWFRVAGIEKASPSTLWRRHGKHGAISRARFLDYFEGSSVACAIRVGQVARLDTPLRLTAVTGRSSVPQSFMYLSDKGARRAGIRC